MSFRLAVCVCTCLLLTGCIFRPYRLDVQQGNYIDRAEISKLKIEMTRAQVRFVLGTPLIADPFNPDRWDYLYYTRPSGRIKDVRRLTLHFEGDRLKRAYADAAVAPLPGQTAANDTATATPPVAMPVGPAAPAPPVAQDPSASSLPSIVPATSTPARPPPPSRSPVLPGRGVGSQ